MQYLGQHFLKNDLAIKKIIAALDIKPGETIIEIGPGKGALTLPMAENFKFLIPNFKILAIEKDEKLADELISKIQELKLNNIKIIKGDALEILPELLTSSEDVNIANYKLVGNIPYYITGKLLRIISELHPVRSRPAEGGATSTLGRPASNGVKNKPPHPTSGCGGKPNVSVLMVQKEVAERICAAPPKMNLLAAATQYWAKPEIILHLKAKEFDPPPEVDSAVIRLTTNNKRQTTEKGPAVAKAMAGEAENYYKLIHIIFKQPRKTLLNNLKEGTQAPKEELETMIKSLNLPINCRPQDLSIKQIIKLSQVRIKS